jgi:hypothetical protein
MRTDRARALVALTIAFAACGGRPAEPQLIRAFTGSDKPISQSGVTPDEGGWRIERAGAGSVPLFEVENPGVEYTTLAYRARMKGSGIQGKAFLEMWVRVPGRGEFFSRGLDQPLTGTVDWMSLEIPFFLNERGIKPDLVKLNVAFDGAGGTVWIKDVQLLHTSLGG